MRFALLLLLLASASAAAQVYRWVDKSGTVNYSNEPPPAGAKASELPIDARPGPPSAQPLDCYSVRCQGERMGHPLPRRGGAHAQVAAAGAVLTPPRLPRAGFPTYSS